MKPPVFVHDLSSEERQALLDGLRSSDAFTLRRSQILLASARGAWAPRIAQQLGCSDQTVLNAIAAFNTRGRAALSRGSHVPHTRHRAFSDDAATKLKALVHRSPRDFKQDTSLWTLDLLAVVSCAEGLTSEQVTGETVRTTLVRLGMCWKRAKQWITSPDAGYQRKKGGATG
ncbi:MAG: helix-turn-helix domain-containing protein [Dehalococcoidia bacterium]